MPCQLTLRRLRLKKKIRPLFVEAAGSSWLTGVSLHETFIAQERPGIHQILVERGGFFGQSQG
jgi:hypothetical protein